MNYILSRSTSIIYKNILKPVLFLIDPEFVHERMTAIGELCGACWCTKNLFTSIYRFDDLKLQQKLHGIDFLNPLGLAAGFDYQAQLTQLLPSIGFGFGTVGTITNLAYAGNPPPRLGRLPKSRSLMVYKGFKNKGAKIVSEKLSQLKFTYPVGVSIGHSNNPTLTSQKKSIADILKCFETFLEKKVNNSYFELNISCPNLFGNVTFYPPKNLEELLREVDRLKLNQPLFIKMPIEKSNQETRKMLEVIVKHKVAGVIFGNLQKNRQDPALIPEEVARFDRGNFSGKPTFKRSNELISFAYKNYGKRLTIIGCGGIFSAEDAYTKIKLGASLVQLITGMIFEGPALIGQINYGLVKLLKQDGFKHVSEAVGAES